MAMGRLALRATVGGLMLGHGLQKLRGSFGGPGIEGTTGVMGQIGMHPARQQAWAAALSETVGGGLTAAGMLNPLGPAMVIGTMAVATAKVHRPNGLWSQGGGYEYNLTLAAAALALADVGSGPLSVDTLLGHRRSGTGWALVAAALGLGAAAAAMAVSDRMAPTGEPVAPTGPGAADAAPDAASEAPDTDGAPVADPSSAS